MTPDQVKKKLAAEGWDFIEGKKHTLAVNKDGRKVPIPRHKTDLKLGTLKAIAKATGISF